MMMVIERRAGRFMAGRRASMFRCFTRRRAGRFMAGSRASMFRSLTRALASAMLSFLHILDTAYELALALVTAGWRRIRMCTHHWIEGLAHITCWKLGLALLNVGQQGFYILATFTIIFGFLTGPVALAHSSFLHLIRDRHLGMLHHCHLRDDIIRSGAVSRVERECLGVVAKEIIHLGHDRIRRRESVGCGQSHKNKDAYARITHRERLPSAPPRKRVPM